MNLNAKCQIGAIFQLTVGKESTGEVLRETEWFHNLVLNSGLKYMGIGEWIDRCSVGTGYSEPVSTQTALDSLVATTTNRTIDPNARGVVTTGDKPYVWSRFSYRFDAGVAKGNIAEVGLGWYNGLWNRALIRDSQGDPTVITVLDDEFLDVNVEVRIYLGSGTGAFDLLDKTGAVRSSHTATIIPFIQGGGSHNYQPIDIYGGDAYGFSALDVYATDIVSMTQRPTGSVMRDRYVNKNNDYSSVERALIQTVYMGIDQMVGTHRTFVFGRSTFGGEGIGYQVQIDPPIEKTALQAMSYTFKISWDSYVPTEG